MNDVDVSKIKPGDVVGVTVRGARNGGVVVGFDAWISHSAIVSHTPAPKPALKVGDRVLWRGREREIGMFAHGHVYLVPLDVGGVPHFRLSEVETWERV